MILKNVRLYDACESVNADIVIEDGKFAEIRYLESSGENPDVILPGFVDIHSHGAAGIDIFGADSERLAQMSRFYAKNGVTTLFPTTISESHDKIMRMIDEVKKACKLTKIDFAGIHLEGPYINKCKCGAHNPKMIKDINLNELEQICAAVLDCGLKLHVTLAPELDGGLDAVKYLKKRGATVSIGHTEASLEIINRAIEFGAVSFTHLFNAMTGAHHRDAGVAVHAINSRAYTELICDGIHVCPEVISMTARAKGLDRIIIVSDSISAAGLPEGEYELGGSAVTISNGKAVLKGTDTIAGSTADLSAELDNFIKFTGASLENALALVTRNPAECVGIYDRKGAVAVGKDADFIIRRGGAIEEVYVKGVRVV